MTFYVVAPISPHQKKCQGVTVIDNEDIFPTTRTRHGEAATKYHAWD
jgi:hypothetical protein